MEKKDMAIIAGLVVLLLAWPAIYPKLFPPQPAPAVPVPEESVAEDNGGGVQPDGERALEIAPSVGRGEETSGVADETAELDEPARPETLASVSNQAVVVTFTSRGAGLRSATLLSYRQGIELGSGPVELDFSDSPALSYSGLPGLAARADFEMASGVGGESVSMTKTSPHGLRLERTATLESDYRLKIVDVISNASDQAASVPAHFIRLGAMRIEPNEKSRAGFIYLGVDALPASGGEGVVHRGGKIPGFFAEDQKLLGLASLPITVKRKENVPIDWLAVKNKFFVQILVPDEAAARYAITAARRGQEPQPDSSGIRDTTSRAALGCGRGSSVDLESLSAEMGFDDKLLAPGESVAREFQYYIGPKKHSILKTLGLSQDEVMEFGMWSFFCKYLLAALNAIYAAIPNYGAAIILLTIIVRILFWPITHKSTESMKRMQELQPMIKELRDKHKSNPKKLQEETFALYKKHKVNPMGGCLPMLVQIPVFIALYRVLGSAIELRFAPFLWISDLSEAENIILFAGQPIALNILPLFMTATMVWQQKITPAGGDPAQQKMMTVFMPLMMLFFFYSMPSALVLYWTTNQCIMIGQQLIARYRAAKKQAAQPQP